MAIATVSVSRDDIDSELPRIEADALRRVVASMKAEALGLLVAAPESRIAPALAHYADLLREKADSLVAEVAA
jgi:hypothetical protein